MLLLLLLFLLLLIVKHDLEELETTFSPLLRSICKTFTRMFYILRTHASFEKFHAI